MQRRTFLFTLPVASLPDQQRTPNKQLLDTLRQHLDLLMEGLNVVKLDGKDAEATTAIAFHRIAKLTGEAKWTRAEPNLPSLKHRSASSP